MLHSPMVFPTTNEYFHVPPMMDENHAKLMNTDPIENYMNATAASTSPIQDYLMAPISANTMNGSFHPQQQHQNQRQHQIQFPIVPQTMPSMIPHSAPSSPQYPTIKAEEVSQQLQHQHHHQQQQNMEFLLYSSSFELGAQAATSPQAHVLPSQRSPQMQQQQRVMYPDTTLLQQQQRQHQQQQQQHDQQLRLQHQQQQFQQQQQQQLQHQVVFDSTPSHSNVSSAVSMSIPITSSIMSSIVSSGSGVSNLFTPSNLTTSTPFFHASSFEQNEYANQRSSSAYTPSAHPAAPRRNREESGQQQMHNNNNRQHSPALLEEESSPVLVGGLVTVAQNKATTSAASPSRASTSARLDKVKATRSTKITKSSSLLSSSSFTVTCSPSAIDMIPSSNTIPSSSSNVEISTAEATPASTTTRSTPKRTSKKSTSSAMAAVVSHDESRESSQQPSDPSEAGLTHLPNSTGNITHPRRAAQNRAAQRTFRNRRKAYIKELEQKVQNMDRTQDLMRSIHSENQEVWRRLQILESLATRSGLTVPSFPALTPVASSHLMTQHTIASSAEGHAHNAATHDYQGMNNNSTHSNEEDEEDEDMSDYSSHPHQQARHF